MGVLKRLLGWYLGVAPTGAEQGSSWKLTCHGTDVSAGWWPMLLAAAGAFVLCVYYVECRRTRGLLRWVLPWLRLATLLLLSAFLGGLTLEVVRTGLPTVAVMIDTSASMGLEDRYSPAAQDAAARRMLDEAGLATPTRLNLAKAVLSDREGELLDRLSRRYRVRLYQFSDAARPLDGRNLPEPDAAGGETSAVATLVADGPQTRPGPSLVQVLNEFRGAPPAAVILLTDGVASVDPADRLSRAVESAGGQIAPLFPIPLGSSEAARDLQLAGLLADPVAFINDPITFDFQVTAYDFVDRTIEVLLRQGAGGDVLARHAVKLAAEGVAVPVRVSFTPRDEGDYEFVVESPPLPGETNLENNVLTKHVRVRREQIRVLLAERGPRWEYRHLKGVLERDEAIELRTVLQESDLTHQQEDRTALAAFPAAREDLFAFDVVILGDIDLKYLHPGALDDLREFVRDRGGGLILIAGERHNPFDFHGTALADLLPFDVETMTRPGPSPADAAGLRLEPTLAGSSHPIFQLAGDEAGSRRVWSELPPLHWALNVPDTKPAAYVLAQGAVRRSGPGKPPVIVLQRFGAGEVLFHASDELWQWRKRTEDLYYGRYWLQAVRFLSRSRLLGGVRGVELTTDRTLYEQGDAARLRVRFVDRRLMPGDGQPVGIAVERSGGRTETVALQSTPQSPTVYEGTLPLLAAGAYHAWLAEPALGESPPSTDFRAELPRRELQLRSADRADLTRAAELSGGAAIPFDDIEQLLTRLPPGSAVPVASAEPFALWSRWEALLLLAGLLGSEWLLRKRVRLI